MCGVKVVLCFFDIGHGNGFQVTMAMVSMWTDQTLSSSSASFRKMKMKLKTILALAVTAVNV